MVIRAAKLEFVAESKLESILRNMLPQLATLYFVARQVGYKRGTYAQQRVSTCNATLLRDKLKKNVARITGPLVLAVCIISNTLEATLYA